MTCRKSQLFDWTTEVDLFVVIQYYIYYVNYLITKKLTKQINIGTGVAIENNSNLPVTYRNTNDQLTLYLGITNNNYLTSYVIPANV